MSLENPLMGASVLVKSWELFVEFLGCKTSKSDPFLLDWKLGGPRGGKECTGDILISKIGDQMTCFIMFLVDDSLAFFLMQYIDLVLV